MNIPKLDIKKKAVVILGAGASRGSSHFKGSLTPAPLDGDFFKILELIQHKDPNLKALLQFIRKEFRKGSYPSMEAVFTQLEALARFHKNLNITPGPTIKSYARELSKFTENLATYFGIVFLDENQRHIICPYHNELAKSLSANDTVVSFNYDCLIDTSLKEAADRSWNTKGGYGIELSDPNKNWDPERTGRGPIATHPIRLLKLHGSLNWDRSNGENPEQLRLRDAPYCPANRAKKEVVPPVWNKEVLNDPVLKELWKEARKRLPTGKVLVVIGYSAPQTDLVSQALIRVSASERKSNQKLTHLIVVNPDREARNDVINLVENGMDATTSVIEIGSFQEFSELLKTD